MPDDAPQPHALIWDVFSEMDIQAVLVDPLGRIVYANPRARALLGVPPGSPAPPTLSSVLSPRNPEWLSREIRKSGARGGWSGDAVFTRLDGTERWIHVQASRLPCLTASDGDVLLLLEDVSERVEIANALMWRAEELYDRNWELEVIGSVVKLMIASSDLESRLMAMLSQAARSVDADGGLVFIKRRDSDNLECRCGYGLGLDRLAVGTAVGPNDVSLAAHTVRMGRTQVVPDVSAEPHALRGLAAQFGIWSALSVPITVNDQAFGALMLGSAKRHRQFAPREIKLVEIIADHASSAICNALLSDDIHRSARLASVGELLSGAAHSFGNVLMAIQGTLEAAKRALGVPEDSAEAATRLDQAQQHVANGSEIIHRLLSFSRGAGGGLGRVSLRQVTVAALDLCREHPAARRRTIENLTPVDTPRVRAQPGPLQEVILNLVLNALQATGEGGRVTIDSRVLEDPGCVALRVTDDGCGMSPDTLAHAFEPFFSTKGGTGLGLPASAAAVHRMGGAITVESAVGEGTTFTVRLKIVGEDKAAQEPLAA